MKSGYQDYLEKRFHEETLGEAVFRTLAEQTGDAGRREKWRSLQQLEKETKELLGRELARLGAPIAEDPAMIARGESEGQRMAALPWPDLMIRLRPVFEGFIEIFETAEAEADGGWNRGLIEHVTRHERALLAFTLREAEGRGEESLGEVVALLDSAPTLSE